MEFAIFGILHRVILSRVIAFLYCTLLATLVFCLLFSVSCFRGWSRLLFLSLKHTEKLHQFLGLRSENVNLKHGVSPGAYRCSGPQTIGRFGANTSGNDCTPHRAGKYTKSSGSPCLSTANTFIPCGLAISPCGLTSISTIAASAVDKSCKWPK